MDAGVSVARQAAPTAPGPDFERWARDELAAVERALETWVPADAPAGLGEAMRYGVLDGGKRLRPLLVLAACAAVDGDRAAALRAAV
ncbi:MAG: polyprenyl synthetase family protein, partial [Rubrivivax sp.]|nr:polyprenyl synthetase family protein [Rubrivivax sp.]